MKDSIAVLVYRVGQFPKVESIPNTLEGMQKIVGGYIECVGFDTPYGAQLFVTCDEEGRLKGKAPCVYLQGVDFCGDVFCTKVDEEGNNVSLDDNDIEWLKDEVELLGVVSRG